MSNQEIFQKKTNLIFKKFRYKQSEFCRKLLNKNVFQKMLKIEVESTFRSKILIKKTFHNILLKNDDDTISNIEKDFINKSK